MLLMGRFTEAAAGIDLLHRGMSAHPDEALHTAVIQRLLLFMQQGGPLEELRPPLEAGGRSIGRHDLLVSARQARLRTGAATSPSQARPARQGRLGAVPRHGQWPDDRATGRGLPPWWETRSR